MAPGRRNGNLFTRGAEMRGGELTMRRLMRAWARRRSRTLVPRLDRLRRIDMIIDFFGEARARRDPRPRPAEAAARVSHPEAGRGRDPSALIRPQPIFGPLGRADGELVRRTAWIYRLDSRFRS
jgi:hypothetical protein